jgi:hypothetical protein
MTCTEVSTSRTVRSAARSHPAYRVFLLLRTVFTVASVLFGTRQVRQPSRALAGLSGAVD